MGSELDLAGKYRLIAELGQGGMATVYLAVALGSSGFRKLAVVKLISPQLASDPDLIEMFLDEARLCARLNHPNVVQTYDVGLDKGRHFMAMEYLDGVPFHAAISRLGKERGPLGFGIRARVLLDVLRGLRYAHELKDYSGKPLHIVHRDVTPHNIFVTYEGQVKLLDFGIAKAATSSVQTATGVIKGKFTYMAPEQALGEAIDARADLYAVGVMLWEALAGRRRFPADLSEVAMFTRAASGEMPEAPNAAALGMPAELDGIIQRAVALEPEDRYRSAGELHAELEAVVRKIEPVSLREFGTTLETAFGDERRRIGKVIEEQFRQMDSGRPTQVAVGPGQLPTVHPLQGTGSLSLEAPPAGRISPLADASVDTVKPQESTTTQAVSTVSPRVPERTRHRIALWSSIAVTVVAAAVAVGVRFGSNTRIEAPAGASGHAADEKAKVVGSSAEVYPGVPSAEPVIVSPIPLAEEGPRDAPAESRDRNADTRSSPSGVSRPNHAHVTPVAHPIPNAASTAVADAVAPAVVDANPPASRPTTTKPKVQLERDNPWP